MTAELVGGVDDQRLAKALEIYARIQKLDDDRRVLEADLIAVLTTGTTSARGCLECYIAAFEACPFTAARYARSSMARDTTTVRKLLKASDPETFHDRLGQYFTRTDQWTQQQGYSLALFVKDFNALGAPAAGLTKTQAEALAFRRRGGLL